MEVTLMALQPGFHRSRRKAPLMGTIFKARTPVVFFSAVLRFQVSSRLHYIVHLDSAGSTLLLLRPLAVVSTFVPSKNTVQGLELSQESSHSETGSCFRVTQNKTDTSGLQMTSQQ